MMFAFRDTMRPSFDLRMQEAQNRAAVARHTGKWGYGKPRDDRWAHYDPDPSWEDEVEINLDRVLSDFVNGWNWLSSRPPF